MECFKIKFLIIFIVFDFYIYFNIHLFRLLSRSNYRILYSLFIKINSLLFRSTFKKFIKLSNSNFY